MELIHTCLMVRDVERSLAFYDRLGFAPRVRTGSGAAVTAFCGLAGDGDRLQLKPDPDFDPAMSRFGHIALEVDDLDAMLRRLAGHAVTPDQPPRRVGSKRICYVHDPDGYAIELIEEKR